MPSLEFATSTVSLPLWAAGGAVAFFVIIGALALTRRGASLAGGLLRVIAVTAGLGTVWMLLDQATQHERSAERRALDQRAADLATRAITPGSPLACLDAAAGDAVESACEKAVFATPETVASAVSYVSARLALLADGAEFARRFGGYENAIANLRLGLEADRYGLVAHVLSVRDSCTPLLCDSYVLLRDPDRVQANLRDRVFDRYVDRYAADWSARAQTPVAAGPGSPYATAAVPAPAAAPTGTPVSSKYDFPSSASIPAVSIMNAEPGIPPDSKAEARPEAKPDAKTTTGTVPARRPQTSAARPRAPAPPAPQPAAPAMAPANSSATALH